MDYRQLLNFLDVCEERSFTKASRKRFITQQGLSKSIKELEDELEVSLFYRDRKGIELTEFGEILEIAAKSYINQHEYIIDAIRQYKEKNKPAVSIGMPNGGANILPPKFFSSFIAEHQDISLNIMNFLEDTCQNAIMENKLQIGFSSAPIDEYLFDSFLCVRSKLLLLVGEQHRFAEGASVKMRDLRGESVIVLNGHMNPNSMLIDLCAKSGVKPEVRLSGSEMGLACELIGSGRFVGFCGEGPIPFPGLTQVEVEDMELWFEFYLIVNRHVYLGEAAKRFIAYAKKRLARKPGQQAGPGTPGA